MIFSSDLVVRAHSFAIEAHGPQTRKYTGDPYVTHCGEVARMVAMVGLDEEAIAAAWLHDTLEDCPQVTVDILERAFNSRVTHMVLMLTDAAPDGVTNRAERKAADRARLAKAGFEIQTIKLADLIDNTTSITAHDPDFSVPYLREKRLLLEEMQGGHPTLRQECERLLGTKQL